MVAATTRTSTTTDSAKADFAHLIGRLTDYRDNVLDPFLGGGTTTAAALRLGQRLIGIDINRRHVEMTRRRIEEVLRPQAAPLATR